MSNHIIVPSTAVTEQDAQYTWAIHEHEIQEHSAQIAALQKEMARIAEVQNAASITEVTRKNPLTPVGWITGSAMWNERAGDILVSSEAFQALYESKWYENLAGSAIESESPAAKATSVPLWALLQFVSVVMLLTGLGSVLFWLLDSPPVLNPFASLLVIVASPFAFMMGVAAKRS